MWRTYKLNRISLSPYIGFFVYFIVNKIKCAFHITNVDMVILMILFYNNEKSFTNVEQQKSFFPRPVKKASLKKSEKKIINRSGVGCMVVKMVVSGGGGGPSFF